MTEEKKETILREYRRHAWDAWNFLSVEDRLRINAEWEAGKDD